jgi:hypothetical protein
MEDRGHSDLPSAVVDDEAVSGRGTPDGCATFPAPLRSRF